VLSISDGIPPPHVATLFGGLAIGDTLRFEADQMCAPLAAYKFSYPDFPKTATTTLNAVIIGKRPLFDRWN